MRNLLISVVAATTLMLPTISFSEEKAVKQSTDYMPTLITATPLEGRMLATTIVRKTIGTIQRNKEAKHRVRKMYAEDPVMLMRAVELINMEFAIIAKANNYWRK